MLAASPVRARYPDWQREPRQLAGVFTLPRNALSILGFKPLITPFIGTRLTGRNPTADRLPQPFQESFQLGLAVL